MNVTDSTIWKHLQRRFESVSDPDKFSDVYDGREYQQHRGFLSKLENISLLLNTDEVSIFRSSTWLVINELPPSVRFVSSQPHVHIIHVDGQCYPPLLTYWFSKDNVLLAGLWFNRENPTMTNYMQPLMTELKQLADIGMQIYSRTCGEHLQCIQKF